MPNSIEYYAVLPKMWEREKKWMSINTVPLSSTALNLFIAENDVSLCD